MRGLHGALVLALTGCDSPVPVSPYPPVPDGSCPPDHIEMCVPAAPCALSICGPGETCLTYAPPVRVTICTAPEAAPDFGPRPAGPPDL